MMDLFITGIVVTGTQVDAYIQTRQIVRVNYVQFLAYLLYTSKRLEEWKAASLQKSLPPCNRVSPTSRAHIAEMGRENNMFSFSLNRVNASETEWLKVARWLVTAQSAKK